MTTVCFTGRGEVGGKLVTRDLWEDAAQRMAWGVNDKGFGVLVASRDDTTKAAKARSNGAVVMSYSEFHGELEMNGITLGGIDNTVAYHEQREIERKISELRSKAKRAAVRAKSGAEREELFDMMEANPLFGSF